MSAEAQIQALIDTRTLTKADAEKFDKGNAAAGTRLRKALQDTKTAAQAARIYVQEKKNEGNLRDGGGPGLPSG